MEGHPTLVAVPVDLMGSTVRMVSMHHVIEFCLCLCCNIVSLAVVVTESAPVLLEGPKDTVVDFYDSVTLGCIASGNPQPTIQWFKDSQLIAGESSQTYTIDSVDLPDRGLYSCTASNRLGSVSSDRVVVNIRGVQQYLVTTYVPASSPPFTGVDLAQSSQLREAELLFLLQVK